MIFVITNATFKRTHTHHIQSESKSKVVLENEGNVFSSSSPEIVLLNLLKKSHLYHQ